MVRHYLGQPIDGFILAATTGEGMTIDEQETEQLVPIAATEVAGQRPVYLGISGSDTRKVAKALAGSAAWPVDGTLIACPYYTRPSQDGLYRHFAALSGATQRPILIYNIPYRTGVNMDNDTLLRLAELPSISGVKDCCVNSSPHPEEAAQRLSRRMATSAAHALALRDARLRKSFGALLRVRATRVDKQGRFRGLSPSRHRLPEAFMSFPRASTALNR